MPALQDLPLPLAVIVAAFWIIQQSNAASSKQLAALIEAFDKQYGSLVKDYEALAQTVHQDRIETRERWLERDRLMNDRLDRNTTELAQSRSEIHQIRNAVQSAAITLELIAREILPGRSARRPAPKPGASDD